MFKILLLVKLLLSFQISPAMGAFELRRGPAPPMVMVLPTLGKRTAQPNGRANKPPKQLTFAKDVYLPTTHGFATEIRSNVGTVKVGATL